MSFNYMDIREFRESGYLQELNRQFLNPLGLALAITQEDDGSERISGVWDYRDNPEGILFLDLSDEDSYDKAEAVKRTQERVAARRAERFGFVVQPIGDRQYREP